MKMTVVYVKDAGHVMAAVTRAALPEASPPPVAEGASLEVQAMVGDSLPIRSFRNLTNNSLDGTRFSLPAEQLATLTVDGDQDQLLSPRGLAVLDGKTVESVPAPIEADFPDLAIVTGDPSTIVVTLTDDALGDLPIKLHLVRRDGPADASQYFQGVFKPATPTKRAIRFTARAPLSGTYDVLMLLKGFRAAVRTLNVP
jgi:hypothetical protein